MGKDRDPLISKNSLRKGVGAVFFGLGIVPLLVGIQFVANSKDMKGTGFLCILVAIVLGLIWFFIDRKIRERK